MPRLSDNSKNSPASLIGLALDHLHGKQLRVITSSVFEAQSPFQRLRTLLADTVPGKPPIDMSVGEPKHGAPQFALDILDAHRAEFSKYPPGNGIGTLRAAIAAWIERRNAFASGTIDPERHVLVLNGTREGLVSALVIAVARKEIARPAVLMPNPFYQAYYAAATATGSEAILLNAGATEGFLPDLDAIDPAILSRTVAFYLASPANPQGVVARSSYLEKLIALAREHSFYVFSDECYSELYQDAPPASAISVAQRSGRLDKVLVFNSLSKRSSCPGLRSGFVAGDPAFINDFAIFRNVASPQVPLPIQHASAALWADEGHVEASRNLYRRKVDLASERLDKFDGFARPEGGFFLWIDLRRLGGGEKAALTLWQRAGVKLLPGSYLAQPDAAGKNPGADYGRVALVDQLDVTAEALDRIAATFA